jgi:hypothetical protein
MKKKRYQPQTQPDFGTGFHTDSDAPVLYERRWQLGNMHHDIIYLSSYVHDAEFRLDEMRFDRSRLTIPLKRARWELDRALGGDLRYIPSQLTVSPVLSLRLELSHESLLARDFLRNPKVIIFRLRTIAGIWNDSDDEELRIDFGRYARLCLRVRDTFKLQLQDKPPSRHSRTLAADGKKQANLRPG